MVNIKEVAERAQVSPATISRYINNSGYVSEKTSKKVEKAIQELNYVPNEVARSLFQKKSKLIGFLLPDMGNPFFPLMAQGIEDYFCPHGYHVITGNIHEDQTKVASYLQTFQQNFVAGIISAVHLPKIAENTPVVVINRSDEDSLYQVKADYKQAAKLMIDELKQTSFEDVVVISDPKSLEVANIRSSYIHDALDKEGISYHTMASQSFLLKDVMHSAGRLFELYPHVDTIFAANDLQAMVLIQKAQYLGYRVPKDIQIIGFDDIPFSELTVPKLTTIKQPAYEMGQTAAKMLHQLITDEIITENVVTLPVELMSRDTLRKKG